MARSSVKQKEFSYRTRQQTWEALKARQTPLDALIVGGGIVGAGCLREFALRGMTDVLLVEKGDFASGTSGVSSKLIHAGIRYLEQAWNRLKEGRIPSAIRDFRFVVQASNERRTLKRIAPHLVKTKRIHLVLGAGDRRSIVSVAAGTWVYFLIQLVQGQSFDFPRLYLRRSAIASTFPELRADAVRAVFTFSDSETDDARLVIENLRSANDLGAQAINYVELLSHEGGAEAVTAVLCNNETGESLTVKARVLINASGPFVDQVVARGRQARPPMVDRVAGSHIDVSPPLSERSFYVTAADGRLVFVLRRDEDGFAFSRVGTTERPLAPGESSEAPRPTPEEIRYLVDFAARYFPVRPIGRHNVIGCDSGIRPLRARGETQSAFDKSREHDVVADGRVYHVVGVKYTDYRRVAREVASRVDWAAHGVEPRPAARTVPLPGGRPDAPAYPERSVAELVDRTMALHWDDIVLRRWGARPRHLYRADPAAFERLFQEASAVFGWDATVQSSERSRFKFIDLAD